MRQFVKLAGLVSAALLLVALFGAASVRAQTPGAATPAPTPIEALLLEYTEIIQKSSRRSIGPAIDALAASGLPDAAEVLRLWRDKELYARESDGRFFRATRDGDNYILSHIVTGAPMGQAGRREVDDIKPNSGIRAMISAALVAFQLADPDPAIRLNSLDAMLRDPEASHLTALRSALGRETDPFVQAALERAERRLTIMFDEDTEARIAAIKSFENDLSVETRGTLNPLLDTRLKVRKAGDPAPENVARTLTPGGEALSFLDAYAMLVDEDLAPKAINAAARDAALIANIADGAVAGVPVASLDSRAARDRAYATLAGEGVVPATMTEDQQLALLEQFVFETIYREPKAITDAANETVESINATVAMYRFADLALDGLSLASIYFLAAIGLAITFGVMGVINMAHGEFIMMGAYTGYVVQLFVPDKTLSILVALPLAFAITFAAGVLLERLVIRWLYHRPLETLLATFGVSIALQQLAKNIFGTQARPLTSPDWLGGALVINDALQISYIRIAIFVLAIVFFVALLITLNRTRLGLEVRAVTQNPRMAASMGINPDRINMLTFGLGSGIAGIAGVAIGLFAKVTSDLGSGYIVQSFMTVVVGGVGNVFGALAGATMIGFLQKGIEALNPSNTLAAQTYMIIFIIIFIQFRPKGIFALKGRAADA
ncbi:urea ABC transporter permease subunit UrtB [Acuticoccus sp. MNP-M23]|uniref:urea ABC transporter permease subunit UrtB n=1 Tax=Acuticoccus sp. MNP-M23 TaxID=3072793 RepID=UPI0028162ABC|nr:urea ABC transporter permease subunit UrtB [Acuticoccus sp. MNP-M23]WMS44970.1 urea ABC transporter permease subunit UrtB [Acuticoccus sp. MNP-M23]